MTAADVLGFALLAGLMFGINPVFTKLGTTNGGSNLQGALMVATVTSVSYWTILLLRRGAGGELLGISQTAIGIFLLAGLFWALGWLANVTGVHRVGASVNSAGISTRPFFSTLLAIAALGEVVTPTMFVGLLVLVTGLVTLSLSKGGDIRGWTVTDLAFPLGAGMLWAVANNLRRLGLLDPSATVLSGVAINTIAAAVLLIAYVIIRGRYDVFAAPKRSYLFFTGTGLSTTLALLALFEGLDRGQVAIVDPIAGTSPLFATALAYLVLRDIERITIGVIAGASLVVLGATLITIA